MTITEIENKVRTLNVLVNDLIERARYFASANYIQQTYAAATNEIKALLSTVNDHEDRIKVLENQFNTYHP